MRELKGEMTVFYSTHILDDVERVSDHVAILDRGRLVRAAADRRAPRELHQDRLRVVLGGADDATASRSRPSPGVASVEPAGARRPIRAATSCGSTPRSHATVQRGVTRFAADPT